MTTSKRPAVLMRVNVSGYSGTAVSMFCAYDPNTEVLAVSRELGYESRHRDGFLMVTTTDRDPAHDMIITEEEFKDAILAYFELDALKLLNLSDGAQRANPASKIERDKVDEGGTSYRIAPDITNSQVSVLIASLMAKRQRAASIAIDTMRDFALISI